LEQGSKGRVGDQPWVLKPKTRPLAKPFGLSPLRSTQISHNDFSVQPNLSFVLGAEQRRFNIELEVRHATWVPFQQKF
jgi:hypothetical protein